MTAPTETTLRTWYEPVRDAGTAGTCYCRKPAGGHTTFYDGSRYRVIRHCVEHLPVRGGGQP